MFERLFGSKQPARKKPSDRARGKDAPKPSAPKPAKLPKVNLKRRFSIIAETGQGSMSTVYRAVDNQSGRLVCLKVQDREKSAAAIERAAKADRPLEGEIGKRIRHPNVVITYDYGITNKKEHWITMEYVEGVSLNFIRQAHSRDLAGKIDLLTQAAEGLAAIHEAGFIHHDFGPKNLLVTRENVAKIIDFGLTVPNTPAFRRPGNRTGTLQYMAPEVIRREPKDERLDIFAWAVMAFEFLTDRSPYDAPDNMTLMRMRMNVDPIDIAQVAPELPQELIAIIRGAIARRPDNRTPSMAKVVEALKAIEIAPARSR